MRFSGAKAVAMAMAITLSMMIPGCALDRKEQQDKGGMMGEVRAAGKRAVEQALNVCAACHGVNGISVAAHIPNLAGQHADYLQTQLDSFKAGSRKNDTMNAIAGQLSDDDITRLSAYFAALPAAANVKSPYLPNLAKTNVALPASFQVGFKRYHTLNVPESNQVKHYFANDAAVSAVKAGKALPDGSSIFIEVRAAKLDGNKKPVLGSDGFFVPDRVLAYTAMSRDAGWGVDIPLMLRNENWNYAIFSADRQLRSGINQAECLACHVPASKSSYVFTLKELEAFVAGQPVR
jgi:cytochrome c553